MVTEEKLLPGESQEQRCSVNTFAPLSRCRDLLGFAWTVEFFAVSVSAENHGIRRALRL